MDSGTCNLQLDFFRLFYLCKSRSPCKMSFPAFCMNHCVKITEVKQARWVKPEIRCFLMYVTTHSKPREDWCDWWAKMAANLNVFKTSKNGCILSKSIFFSQKLIRWYLESDKKIKVLTIWALKLLYSCYNSSEFSSTVISMVLCTVKRRAPLLTRVDFELLDLMNKRHVSANGNTC